MPSDLGAHDINTSPSDDREARLAFMEIGAETAQLLAVQPVLFGQGYAIAPDRPGDGITLSDQARREHAVAPLAQGLCPAPPAPIQL